MKRAVFLFASYAVAGCAAGEHRFPMRNVMWRDTDLASVSVRCRAEPTPKDAHHVSCAPATYDSPLYWDGTDNLFFRPLSEMLGVVTSYESVNVNSLDEVPDSSWFTNRIAHIGVTELRQNACPPDKLLDPASATPGSWLIDKGKTSGSTPGFRVTIPGKGKYMIKLTASDAPRQIASSVIGEAVYWAAGYNASCEQGLWVSPSIFKLAPGLRARDGNFGDEFALDQHALDGMLARSFHRGDLVRVSASAWVPGFPIGAFRYEGTRSDDPNDVIPHENRRELRGARVLAAWIDHFDAREANSLDMWIADKKKAAPDSSPGHVIHYQFDTSDALGSLWDWDAVSRRLGSSYVIDWRDIALDFVTLGIPKRPWDDAHKTPGQEMFGYFDVASFDPETWKSEYPNPAFSRMTERDGAWMARILARFTPEMVRELAHMVGLDAPNAKYLADVLEGRLARILDRYLTRLSPLADVHVEGDTVCAVDLAELRHVRDWWRFHYAARIVGGGALTASRRDGAEVCVTLPHGAPRSYLRIAIEDTVAKAPLVVHLYDVGSNGFRLAGVERPEK